ncbi:hypothetical protein [Desulforegula conservatrix]|uniref:hypothetical protein n=1 Tax=Desulforegula conservatrix TaxID=153026 RepID=UPI000401474B|nr:hypothetical protein [Desulforegula conservatrix]
MKILKYFAVVFKNFRVAFKNFGAALKKFKKEPGTIEILILGLLLFLFGFFFMLYATNVITEEAQKIYKANVLMFGDLSLKLSVGCLIALTVSFLKEYSKTKRDIDKFEEFFGKSGFNEKGMPAIMIKINPTTKMEYYIAGKPQEAKDAEPKNISGLIPIDEIEGTLALQELFVSFGAGIEVMATQDDMNSIEKLKELFEKGIFAIGLGFNQMTKAIEAMSGKFFEIDYVDFNDGNRTFKSDTYKIHYPLRREKSFPNPDYSDDSEHALIARILYPINKDKYVPSFVCAGLTAQATTLSCKYLKDHWKSLYGDCIELTKNQNIKALKAFQMNYAWSIKFTKTETTKECKAMAYPLEDNKILGNWIDIYPCMKDH